MNAMIHSFDRIETAPLPWAIPIPIEYAPVGARGINDAQVANAARTAFDKILTIPPFSAKAETAVSSMGPPQAWAENTNLISWVAAHECLGRSMLSDTKVRASVQTMRTIATVKAWIEKQSASGNTESVISTFLQRAFAPQYINVCDHAAAGSMVLLTGVSATSWLDFDSTGAIGCLLFPDASSLAGYDRYSVRNWDGDQAEAILPETIAAARSLLQALPSNFGEPDIAPAADGTIGLEWIPETGSLRKLFIDVGPKTVWRAYWKFANGKYGEAHGLISDSDLSDAMKKLFRDLSK
jgi:hypothetical protein